MALPYSFIGKWNYTNPATSVAVNIPMTDKPDWVIVKNLTDWGDGTTVTSVESEWFSGMAAGAYISMDQTITTNALSSNAGTSGGFTFIDQSNPPTYTKVAVTAVNGTTFVVSTGNTAGISVGDFIRLINITSALELSGFGTYEVTAVTANTSITLGFVATSGLTVTNGTTGYYQKVYPNNFYPKYAYPVAITQATQAKIYFGKFNDYSVGEMVDFQIPTLYGMTQLSNLTAQSRGPARVLQVTNTFSNGSSNPESSIVIDVDTTGFTAFAVPTSAQYATAGNHSPAVCFPAGSGVVPLNGSATIPLSPPGTNLVDAFDNHDQYVMNLGLNVVGEGGSNMVVMAFKADFNNAISNA
jgi:hypothetical protein